MGKIVFINAYEYPYLGTRVLASFLREKGHETHNILLGDDNNQNVANIPEKHLGYAFIWNGRTQTQVANINPITDNDLAALEKVLREENPDIVGFSARSTNNYLIPLLVPVFRRACPHSLLVAGGFGPTLEPELYLDGGFDVVVRGDGEEALLELMECVENKAYPTPPPPPGAYGIANTLWSAEHGGHKNSMRDQEKDISKYPAPLYGNDAFTVIALDEVKRNYDPVISQIGYSTYLGRGCTGTCSYCSGGQWRSLYRQEGKKAYPRRNRHYEDVIAECENLPENIKFILFMDEFWSMPKKETFNFFKLYKERVHKDFFAYLQYEQIVNNQDLFELVLDAGLAHTGVGIQSGSEKFLLKYYSRHQQYDVMLRFAKMMFDNFVSCSAQFIAGNCYETEEDFLETLAFIKKLPFSIEQPNMLDLCISRLRPHPKSPITKIAPKVITEPMPINDWLYRTSFMYLANKISGEDLSELMGLQLFKREPNKILDFARSIIARKQREHYDNLLATKQDEDWVFYGGGENYLRNSKYFAALNPRAILVDRDFLTGEKTINNIPVICTEDFFANHDNDALTNYLIFVIPHYMGYPAHRNFLRKYNLNKANIHSCEIDINVLGY